MLRILLDFTLVMVLNDYLVTGNQYVTLVGGLDNCSGRVLFHYNDTLWTVCGDSWDIDDAAVVCRELGCGRAIIADGQGLFGVGDRHNYLTEVNCKGEESSFTQCIYKTNANCHNNDAGVICSASSVIIIGAVVTAVLFLLSVLIIIFLVRRRQKRKKIQIRSNSKDAVNMRDVLHNNQNEDNAEDDYEVVDMDDGAQEDVNSDSDQDYVNVDPNDLEPDYINVESDDSEQDYVNVETTELRCALDNNYEHL